jgi:hypothetical protein
MKRLKTLSHGGPSAISKRGMSEAEARAYHHVYDEPDSDHVVLTWPRTIPLREGDRGWDDMATLESRLPEIGDAPTLLLWGKQDSVFGESYARRFKEKIPHAEGPFPVDGTDHFMQDDKGEEIAGRIVDFLQRTLPPTVDTPGKPRGETETAIVASGWTLELHSTPIDERAFRLDPLLTEQELDVRPAVAEALESAAGIRAGIRQWKSRRGHRYALELGDLGRGRPSTATVYGLWERWEPRPPDSEIDADLLEFCLWMAELSPEIEASDVSRVASFAGLELESTNS